MTQDKLQEIKNKLYHIDWIGQLSSESCNTNFDMYSVILKEVMDEAAPLKTVQISGKRRFKEPWMSKGIKSWSIKNNELDSI